MLGAPTGPATVSTLKEAEYLLAHGVQDILYAVGLAPNKLDHVFDLRRRGANLSVILDNAEMAARVVEKACEWAYTVPVLLEIDTDGHRSGLAPNDPELVAIGRILAEVGPMLAGVITHAGSSYDAGGEEALVRIGRTRTAGHCHSREQFAGGGSSLPNRQRRLDPYRAFRTRSHRRDRGARWRLYLLRPRNGRAWRLQAGGHRN